MRKNKTALAGIRDESYRRQIYDLLFRKLEYITTVVSTQEKMYVLMNKREYDLYVMEMDLGNPGSVDTTVAKNLYNNLEERIKLGDVKFLCLCNNLIALNNAHKEGISACLTSKLISDPRKFIK